MIKTNLLSGALGAEITGIDLKDSTTENWNKINNLLLEHKALFFRNQDISSEEQINLAKHFGPLEKHIYVKGREEYPEILRIIKEPDEKHQWGETWHTDVSYNPKPTKVIILRSLKIPPVGGDTMFSNMEIAYETLEDKIKDKIKEDRKKAPIQAPWEIISCYKLIVAAVVICIRQPGTLHQELSPTKTSLLLIKPPRGWW